MITLNAILAAKEPLGDLNGQGFGPLQTPVDHPGTLLEKLLSNIVGFLVVGAILWFVVQFVLAGYSFMTAGGDPKAAADARNRIVNASIGLVVAFIALIFTSIIASLVGIDVLDINGFLSKITIGGGK